MGNNESYTVTQHEGCTQYNGLWFFMAWEGCSEDLICLVRGCFYMIHVDDPQLENRARKIAHEAK